MKKIKINLPDFSCLIIGCNSFFNSHSLNPTYYYLHFPSKQNEENNYNWGKQIITKQKQNYNYALHLFLDFDVIQCLPIII